MNFSTSGTIVAISHGILWLIPIQRKKRSDWALVQFQKALNNSELQPSFYKTCHAHGPQPILQTHDHHHGFGLIQRADSVLLTQLF